jgi:hypothetical protein
MPRITRGDLQAEVTETEHAHRIFAETLEALHAIYHKHNPTSGEWRWVIARLAASLLNLFLERES